MNLTMTQPEQPLGKLIDGLVPSDTDLPSTRISHLTLDSREVSCLLYTSDAADE